MSASNELNAPQERSLFADTVASLKLELTENGYSADLILQFCAMLECIREQQAALEKLLAPDSATNMGARNEARATLARWRIE